MYGLGTDTCGREESEMKQTRAELREYGIIIGAFAGCAICAPNDPGERALLRPPAGYRLPICRRCLEFALSLLAGREEGHDD